MIRVLDKFIADKIAAGEVIERPVSAVKELVENSLDACARSVIVEIRGGGKSYIRVTDDGSGIPSEETETAFLRHATSKISGITDLDNITSLGFRGEALASIAAVSKITMVTRTSGSTAGARLMLHGGKLIGKETIGANVGTTIVAEDLFYNTPARRKFMRSDAREASAVIDLVQQYAVCYPSIRFMMISNGSTVFTTQGDGNLLSTIQVIYPDTDHKDLIEVSGDGVSGYISDPGTTRNNRKGQLFFVNGRLVSSPVIEKGLEKGYGGRIFSGFPVAVLFIEQDPSSIDVNIHPGKRDIRFLHADEVEERIRSAVDAALRVRQAVPAMSAPARYGDPDVVSQVEADSPDATDHFPQALTYKPVTEEDGLMFTGEQSSIRDYLSSIRRDEKPSARETEASSPDPAKAVSTSASTQVPRSAELFDFAGLSYAGYIFDTYIIMQGRDEMYIFDQHAAHERINYERFREAYLSREQAPQPMLTPVTLNVSADIYNTAKEMLEPLVRMGYDISDFGMGSFIIRGIPSYVTMSEAVDFVKAYLDDAANASGVNDTVIDKLIMKSCKASVKGGEKLSRMEIDELIGRLERCSNPYSCPHGRPTFIRFTRYEIERSFRRK